MAKEKRSAADLDAELAALEAELAALEGKPKKKAKKAEAKAPAPAASVASAPAPEAAPAPAEEKSEKRSRFSLPKFGKKKEEAPPAPVVAEATFREEPAPSAPAREEPAPVPPAREATRAPAPVPAELRATYDAGVWRHEDNAWVRIVPETRVPAVRRILDEEGNVVREEPADARDVESVSSVKAERGLGRLLRRK